MFAVSSVEAAKLYYEALNSLQKDSDKPPKIATIYSFSANEEQEAVGDIMDESFDVSAMNSSAKEFLTAAINDYNGFFKPILVLIVTGSRITTAIWPNGLSPEKLTF